MENNQLKEFAKEIYGECVKRNLNVDDYRRLLIELEVLKTATVTKRYRVTDAIPLQLQDIEDGKEG